MNLGMMAVFKVIVTFSCLASVMTSSLHTPNKSKITEILDTIKRVEAGACDPMTMGMKTVPGVGKMFKGVDLTKLDFYDRESFKREVLEMTCKDEKTKAWNTDNGDKYYAQPDQILSISFDNSGSFSSSATVIESASDMADSFSASVSVSGKYGPVSGSASVSYKKMSRNIAENKFFYSVVEATETTATYTIKSDARLSKDANNSLPWGVDYDRQNDESKYKYYSFISQYGTHHFDRGFYGGVVRMVVKTEASLSKRFSRSEIGAAASLKYNGLIGSASVSASMSKSQQKASKEFNSKSSEDIKYYGGYTNLMPKKGESRLTKWQPSVRLNPYMMGGTLSPIYERIEDKQMKDNMKKAMDDYLKESYYGTLKSDINSYIKHFKHSDKDNILSELKNFRATLVVGSAEDERRDVVDVKRQYDDIMEELGQVGKYGSSCRGRSDCKFSTYGICLEGICRCDINHVYSPGDRTCRQECENNEYGYEFVKYPHRYMVVWQNGDYYNTAKNFGNQASNPEKCVNFCLDNTSYNCLSFNYLPEWNGGYCIFTKVAMNVPMGSELVDTSFFTSKYTVYSSIEHYYQRQCL